MDSILTLNLVASKVGKKLTLLLPCKTISTEKHKQCEF